VEPHDEPRPRARRRLNKAMMSGLALLGVGAIGGAVAATAGSASAATTTATGAGSSVSGGSSAGTVPGSGRQRPGDPPGGTALPLHGTVTAVGSSSVTIETSTGTTTYAVTNSSAIEKKGKTTLRALSTGDMVAFSVVTTDGTATIDKLVAGGAPSNMAGGCGPGGATSHSGGSSTPGAPGSSGPPA
jgi:hypothetical protein